MGHYHLRCCEEEDCLAEKWLHDVDFAAAYADGDNAVLAWQAWHQLRSRDDDKPIPEPVIDYFDECAAFVAGLFLLQRYTHGAQPPPTTTQSKLEVAACDSFSSSDCESSRLTSSFD